MKVIDFIYESIETLKEVKIPTKKEVINMTIAVLVIITIMAIYLGILDQIFAKAYQTIYQFLNSK